MTASNLSRVARGLAIAIGLLIAPIAFAQNTVPTIPGEPAPAHLRETPVSPGTLTRDGALNLSPGAAQAGGGPGFETQTGQFGLPVSTSYGLSDALELGGGFNILMLPGFQLRNMFVSHFTVYGRYSVVPRKLSLEFKLNKPGPLIAAGGIRAQVEAPFTTELSDVSRIYIMTNLGALIQGSLTFDLNTSATYMHKITDLFYLQGLAGTGLGFNGQGVYAPGAAVPILLGTGGGVLLEENTGVGLALTVGLGGTGGLPGQSALNSFGVLFTYTKGL